VFLGGIAGGVGGDQHAGHRVDAGRRLDQPNAGADLERPPLPDEGQAADFLDHRRRLQAGRFRRDVAKHDAELVATQAGDEVGRKTLVHQARQILQQEVASSVAAGIVDCLELVEVEIKQAERFLAKAQRVGQVSLESAPVVHAGQRVVPGLAGQFLDPRFDGAGHRREAARQHADLVLRRHLDAHRVVVARAQFERRVVVVDDVDAADEGDQPVDHDQLAVQAAQAVATQVEAADLRPVEQRADAGGLQLRQEIGGEIARAETVDRDVDLDAARGGPAQRAGDGMADRVGGEDVAFEVDLDAGGGEGGEQFRKVFAARAEQGQPVARQKLSGHAASGGRTARRGRTGWTRARRNGPRYAARQSRAHKCGRAGTSASPPGSCAPARRPGR